MQMYRVLMILQNKLQLFCFKMGEDTENSLLFFGLNQSRLNDWEPISVPSENMSTR